MSITPEPGAGPEVPGESEDDIMEKVHKQFETYNKKFNRTHQDTNLMEFRSFKHMICDISCLSNIKRDDRFAIFDEQSTDGTGYLTFPRFQKAMKRLASLEGQYRSGGSQRPPTVTENTIMREITHLNPNNVRQWFKSLLNTIVDNEPSITKVTSTAGNSLKMIGMATVKELVHVGTAVVWIGPAVKLLRIIWERIIALEEITDDLIKFADTLSYLSETVEFIDESSLYHTNMMEKRMRGLEKVLKKAEELFNDVEQNGKSKVKMFFSAKEDQERLKDMEEDLNKWISQTYLVQLAENQELTLELQRQQEAMQKDLAEFMTENQSHWKFFEEQMSIIIKLVETSTENLDVETSGGGCRDADNHAVPPGVEMARPTQAAATGKADNLHISISAALPRELIKSNSDILIYHDYDDRAKAWGLRDKLIKEMTKLRLQNGKVKEVRIHILDEFQSEGVPQAQLEAALHLASVKLLLVTKKFTELKSKGDHPLEIFQILDKSCSGQVFALRWDPDYQSYLKQLDFYVQGLMQGCFYDPHRDDFVTKMNDLFRRNLKLRLDRDKELNEIRDQAERKEDEKWEAKEKDVDDMKKRMEDIERQLQDTSLSEEKREKLEKEFELQMNGGEHVVETSGGDCYDVGNLAVPPGVQMALRQMNGVEHVVETRGGDCHDVGNLAVPPGVEMARGSQTAAAEKVERYQYAAVLPPELINSNSDFLIYHDSDDRDTAQTLKDDLIKRMVKFTLAGDVIGVKIHTLNELDTVGIRQENLEAALNLASVKLILVTKRLIKYKNKGTHPHEIFKILHDNSSGRVFALRWDPDYNSYLKQLDFYVQGLMQGCFYDPHRDDFVTKMNDLFRRNLKLRLDRDKELDKKRRQAELRERVTRKREEQKLKEYENEINERLADPDISAEDLAKLLDEFSNRSKRVSGQDNTVCE